MGLEIRISPPPSLFRLTLPDNVIGLAKEMLELLAWIVPERMTVPPVPVSEKGPERRVDAPAVNLKTPVLEIETGPPLILVVVRVLAIVKLVPVKLMPETPFAFRFPVIAVVPKPEV